MPDVAIQLDQVWKKFKKGESYNSLRDLIPAITRGLFARDSRDRLQAREFWALKDVSFEVKFGDALGIIGPNGAGKSTILKLLSKILQPTKGNIRVNGRLSALIEVGAGFHPDLTGRENVYLNGSILGMRKSLIDRKFDEIVDFSGLEEFIDTPVKRYSSGMYARLGFGVVAHMEPEILLVDEVLAVGDAQFWSKCIQKMRALISSGTPIVLVTHNMFLVQTMCTRAICLAKGRIVTEGKPLNVIGEYRGLTSAELKHATPLPHSEVKVGSFTFQVFPEGVWSAEGEAFPDSGLRARMVAQVSGVPKVRFLIRATSTDGFPYFTVFSDAVEIDGSGRVACEVTIPHLMLLAGEFQLWGSVCSEKGEDQILAQENFPFIVRDHATAPPRSGLFWNEANWRLLSP